jgi:aldehyde:ferredoxin oxidoreductase
MECYENGIITKEDTDGIELTWGNNRAIVQMTEKLAKREGFGDVLADGVKRAAERIGKGSDKYAIHAGGQELAMHDPRLMFVFAPSYECDATPGRHTSGFADVVYASYMRIMNTAGMCMFPFICAPGVDLSKFVSTATGWDFTQEEMLKVGERISNIRQAFNVREGVKPIDFVMTSGRPIGDPPLEKGPTAGVTVDAKILRSEIFKGMDWDIESGKPSKEKLESLGLDDVAKELWG